MYIFSLSSSCSMSHLFLSALFLLCEDVLNQLSRSYQLVENGTICSADLSSSLYPAAAVVIFAQREHEFIYIFCQYELNNY